MSVTAVDVVKEFLQAPADAKRVREVCAPDATYVSLNYSNPDPEKSMPWCGTSQGPEAITDVFSRVARYWMVNDFAPLAIFGEGEHVAVFGTMTLTSTVLGKTVTTPFSIWCRVRNGKIQYMQFMEDTFATSSRFRSGGQWTFRSNPDGGEVSV
jgi:ketosteroid isomerase-like protein